ncbi:hypothetical protein [Natrialba taiwanensis]|uniref:hypothetical protein n=1 Tax=Natrialba taiwanensis TaxID=160846 RepID=UPI0012688EEC|nr:hypothetical protein [Natrialba taiwanensis]
MSLLTQVCEIDVPDSQGDYLRCLDRNLQDKWPGMTAVRLRLLQSTFISLLIGALAYSLDGSPTFAIGSIAAVNIVLLADVIAVASVEVSSSGITVTMQDNDDE